MPSSGLLRHENMKSYMFYHVLVHDIPYFTFLALCFIINLCVEYLLFPLTNSVFYVISLHYLPYFTFLALFYSTSMHGLSVISLFLFCILCYLSPLSLLFTFIALYFIIILCMEYMIYPLTMCYMLLLTIIFLILPS
jgi:hypothetical protein